jgi:hypothetical protein
VGGPSQIAVLANGSIQHLEQPIFPPVAPSPFAFRIVSTMKVDFNSPGTATSYGVVINGSYGVYFKNEFIHVRQILDGAYYGKNVFKDCVLMYRGGTIQFETSNEVINSDLEIAADVSPNFPAVQQLLNDFQWRNVKYLGKPPKGTTPMK